MKKNLRGKVNQFLTSEVGQVGIRAPLALGVASGILLLSQAVHTPSAEAGMECLSDSECGSGEWCNMWCEEYSQGTCTDWQSECDS